MIHLFESAGTVCTGTGVLVATFIAPGTPGERGSAGEDSSQTSLYHAVTHKSRRENVTEYRIEMRSVVMKHDASSSH